MNKNIEVTQDEMSAILIAYELLKESSGFNLLIKTFGYSKAELLVEHLFYVKNKIQEDSIISNTL